MVRAVRGLLLVALLALGPGCPDDQPLPQDAATPDPELGPDGATDGGGPDVNLGDLSVDLLADGRGPDAPTGPRELTILHTADLHGRLLGSGPNSEYTPLTTADGDGTVGGTARLAAKLRDLRGRAGSTPVLLLDAGGALVGSIFDTLSPTQAPTLATLGRLGYDALTLGERAFDWGPAGLTKVLQAGAKAGLGAAVLASNLTFSSTDSRDDSLELLFLKPGQILHRNTLKTLSNGLKVGIFGLLGRHGISRLSAAAEPLSFAEMVATAKTQVQQLRQQGADLVICLAHAGLAVNGAGEARDLAIGAPGIDVLVAGHTHVGLSQPVTAGQTVIVQAGPHGAQVGELKLQVDAQGAVTLRGFTLHAVNDTVAGDATEQSRVDAYLSAVEALGLWVGAGSTAPADSVVCETTADIATAQFAESGLGDLVADAYADQANLQQTTPVDLGLVANGDLRAPILRGRRGQQWLTDIYQVVPLGASPDGGANSPLVVFNLPGPKLKLLMELPALAKDFLKEDAYFLQVSGDVKVTYDTSRSLLDRVTALSVGGKPYDINRCYRLVTTLALADEIRRLAQLHPALVVAPMNSTCNKALSATELRAQRLDASAKTPGIQELSAFLALYGFFDAFPDLSAPNNGVPDIPSSYRLAAGRMTFQ